MGKSWYWCVVLLAGTALAQHPQITFYNGGNPWTAAAPGAKNSPFLGAVFLHGKRLADFRIYRFLTLQMPAGEYDFSASTNFEKDDGKSSFKLTMADGQHYFIRLTERNAVADIVSPVRFDTGQIELVSCTTAHQEIAQRKLRMKPVEEKYLSDEALDWAVNGWTFPDCPK